jgi:tetratricopeptide (TPR) repeat protein
MRHTATASALLTTLLGTSLWLAGCDKMPGAAKPEAAPAQAPAPVAPPVAAPAPAPVPVAAAPEPAPAAAPAGRREPSLEVRSHIKQAFSYISLAKNAQGTNREENIDNALKEFSLAIQKDPQYAEAYSSRAVAYMQQQKFNKAEEDLRKAKELSPDSPSVRYNLASLHSLKGNVDLALDEIDAALAKGFTDYDALRRDPDLDNLRKHPEFRKILEKHKVFIVK